MVESQPSKLLVAGSIPVSRSIAKFEEQTQKSSNGADAFWCEASSERLISNLQERADVAQLVEHVLGKDGVSGSIPLIGSRLSA